MSPNIQVFGKPLEKLIETVSKGIGIRYKPTAIRNEADAEAYKIEKIAEAQAKAAIIKADSKDEIAERAKQRLYHQEMQRQMNIEHVIDVAAGRISDIVSEEPVDEDWRTRFFNKAQDITSRELQEVWGKILANEINKPGTISVRTLDILSNLSKLEAELLGTIGTLECSNSGVFKFGNNNLEKYGLTYDDLLILRSAGLLHESDNLSGIYGPISVFSAIKPNATVLRFGKQQIVVYRSNGETVSFNHFALTPAAKEILRIIDCDLNNEYINEFQSFYTKMGYVFVSLHEFIEQNNVDISNL